MVAALSLHYERRRRYAPSRVAGDVLVSDGTQLLLATSANVASYGLPDGIASDAADAQGAVAVASLGRAYASTTGLATGSAAWARVSTAGRLERVTTPAATDIVMGWAEANGDVHLCPPMTGRMALGGSQITGVSPSPAFVGQTVTVSGSGFTGVDAVVVSGGTVTPTSVTDTQVQFVQPNASTGTSSIALTEGGTQVGGSSTYLVDHRPLPVSITPSSGYTAGGTAVTISGYQLGNVTSVTIGGVACTSVVAVDAHTVTAVTGPHAAAAGLDVVVSGSDGTNTLAGAYSYVQWTPALDTPTSWYENYAGTSLASLPSAGSSGGAPHLTNPGAYPPAGTLNGFGTVDFNGRTLLSPTIGSHLSSLGPNLIIALVWVPTTTNQPSTSGGNPATARLVSDNTFRWTMAIGGSNAGGTPGILPWMAFNKTSDGSLYEPPASIASAGTAGRWMLLYCQFDGTLGMTCGVIDSGTAQTAAGPDPSFYHYNGFGPGHTVATGWPANDTNLSFDLATNLILGGRDENATGSGGVECSGMRLAMLLTYFGTLGTTRPALVLDYVRRKFGVP